MFWALFFDAGFENDGKNVRGGDLTRLSDAFWGTLVANPYRDFGWVVFFSCLQLRNSRPRHTC